MNLNNLLPLLAVLVCPITMSIMMWKMNKNINDQHMHMRPQDQNESGHTNAEENLDSAKEN